MSYTQPASRCQACGKNTILLTRLCWPCFRSQPQKQKGYKPVPLKDDQQLSRSAARVYSYWLEALESEELARQLAIAAFNDNETYQRLKAEAGVP